MRKSYAPKCLGSWAAEKRRGIRVISEIAILNQIYAQPSRTKGKIVCAFSYSRYA